MKKITIIGAGLSGTLLAINLLMQNWPESGIIYWIECNSDRNMGFAYSTDEEYLLNVPVELMSAFSNKPESFLQWSRVKDHSLKPGAFLPRNWYRDYVQELLKNAIAGKNNIQLVRIRNQAIDITMNDNRAKVYLKNNESIETDKVVLAIGNPLPGNPHLADMEYINDKRYVQNPWDTELLDRISKNAAIVFIGSGQTMVDLVTGLFRRKHQGRLISISRRGILPLPHKMAAPYPSFFDELKDLSTILSVFQIVRKHLKIAEEKKLDPRSVIDSLRPYTTRIWMNLPAEEKNRFLRHLFRHWEIIRSRIPPASETIVKDLRNSGQLKIFAGRLKDIIPGKGSIQVTFTQKDPNIERTLTADYIINCKGPDLDYEKIEQQLIQNLLKSKLMKCDPVHLGIDALPEGSVITEGKPSNILFTLGPPLKGILWESIAAPEIRAQAENLSRILINSAYSA